MLNNMIPLLGSFLNSGIMVYIFYPILCLAFVATVPYIIRAFFRG